MAISRYWRIVGISTLGGGDLELSEVRMYEDGVIADTGATLTATIAPSSGAVIDLQDGDTETLVVWPPEAHSQPGFALRWDFGSGGGVEAPRLRLGSGDKADCFPSSLILQYSADARSWTALETVNNILYPGDRCLTTLVEGPIDEYASNVVLSIRANGANGSTTLVDDTGRHTMTATGGAQISTAQYVSGASSLYLPNNGGIYTGPSDDFNFGSDDFTVECQLYPLSTTGGAYIYGNYYQTVMGRSQSGSNANANFSVSLKNLKPIPTLFKNGLAVGSLSATSALTVNQWTHVEYSRSGGTVYLFVNGALEASTSISGAIGASTRNFVIGSDSSGVENVHGYIDNVRVTRGVCRHTASFTPPVDSRGLESTIPMETPRVPRFTGGYSSHTFFDAYNGGLGTIVGTVKEKNLPVNTPLHRRVLLLDQRSQQVIRETWSDAGTGAYSFRGVRQDLQYTVLAYDYTQDYRAVVADNITPELLP